MEFRVPYKSVPGTGTTLDLAVPYLINIIFTSYLNTSSIIRTPLVFDRTLILISHFRLFSLSATQVRLLEIPIDN